MQRKILDVWPRLLRPLRPQNQRNEGAVQDQERSDGGTGEDEQQRDELDEEELLEFYKNFYWTRLITIESSVGDAANQLDQRSRYAVGPDIVEELRELAIEAPADPDEWQAAFDPDAFTSANQPLSLTRFRLTEEQLRSWAERLTRMRAEVEARAKRFIIAEPHAEEDDQVQRSRKGLKRSVPAHNPDRLSEGEL